MLQQQQKKKNVRRNEEQEQVYKASPVVKELLMRYALYYHSPQGPQPIGTGSARVGYYFDELIYAPRYYGYEIGRAHV